MKPSKPIPRLSAKKRAALKGRPVYSTISVRRVRPKKKPRKKSETLRIYGPPDRRAFVASLPCAACGVVGYSENAHLLGNGGTGRRADADTIGPLCGAGYRGCHRTYDEHRAMFDYLYPDFDPEEVARETEELWASSVLEDTKT